MNGYNDQIVEASGTVSLNRKNHRQFLEFGTVCGRYSCKNQQVMRRLPTQYLTIIWFCTVSNGCRGNKIHFFLIVNFEDFLVFYSFFLKKERKKKKLFSIMQ